MHACFYACSFNFEFVSLPISLVSPTSNALLVQHICMLRVIVFHSPFLASKPSSGDSIPKRPCFETDGAVSSNEPRKNERAFMEAVAFEGSLQTCDELELFE